MPSRVLLVRAGALGDLLLLRRTIAALQADGRVVSLLAPSGPAAAVLGDGPGDVAEVLPWESARFASLLIDGGRTDEHAARNLRGYDAAIAYTRSETLAHNLARLISAVVRRDPSPPAGGPHAAEWLASALRELGISPDAAPAPLVPSAADARRARATLDRLPPAFLAIHPGSGSASKNWGAERFAALARRIAPERWLLVHGPADDQAVSGLTTAPGACVARDLPLRVLSAVLARAGAYVGNDSGVTHLAAASGAPTIALFGPTDPAVWAPVGPRVRILGGGGSMEGIAVEDVAGAIEGLRTT